MMMVRAWKKNELSSYSSKKESQRREIKNETIKKARDNASSPPSTKKKAFFEAASRESEKPGTKQANEKGKT